MDDIEKRRSDLINSALNHISKSTLLCKQYLDANEMPIMLQELNKCVEDYCKLDISLTAFNKALDRTENLFANTEKKPDEPVSDVFNKIHEEEKLTNFNEDLIARHPYMIQFKQNTEEAELEKEVEHMDDSVIADTNFTPPVDPITKGLIKNPVRNTQCGHVYEDDSIRALMKNKNIRCPYIGCPSTSFIKIHYLKPDFSLKKKIDYYILNNGD